ERVREGERPAQRIGPYLESNSRRGRRQSLANSIRLRRFPDRERKKKDEDQSRHRHDRHRVPPSIFRTEPTTRGNAGTDTHRRASGKQGEGGGAGPTGKSAVD